MHAATIRGQLLFLSLSSRCGYYSRAATIRGVASIRINTVFVTYIKCCFTVIAVQSISITGKLRGALCSAVPVSLIMQLTTQQEVYMYLLIRLTISPSFSAIHTSRGKRQHLQLTINIPRIAARNNVVPRAHVLLQTLPHGRKLLPYTTKFSLAKIFTKGHVYWNINFAKFNYTNRASYLPGSCGQSLRVAICMHSRSHECVKIFTVQKNCTKIFINGMHWRNWQKFSPGKNFHVYSIQQRLMKS